MYEVIMPKAGMAMEEGTIVQWLKKEGDLVRKGEDLLTIETNKITMDEPAPADGILLKILYEDGDVVPVTAVIALIGQAGELELPDKKVAATPAARRLAKEAGIDITTIAQTSGNKVLRQSDIARLADQAMDLTTHKQEMVDRPKESAETEANGIDRPPVPAEDRIQHVRLTGARQVIARQMTLSHQTVPASTTTIPVDGTRLESLRKEINQRPETHITLTDLVMMSAVRSLRAYPRFNAHLTGDDMLLHDSVHIGIAVGLDDNLLVPVLKNAQTWTLFDLSNQRRHLTDLARNGGLKPDDLAGATFTVSNMGMFGVTHFTPIINAPEVAILGVCALQNIVVPGNATSPFLSREQFNLCLTYDHRVNNGIDSARFLNHLKEQLENPIRLII